MDPPASTMLLSATVRGTHVVRTQLGTHRVLLALALAPALLAISASSGELESTAHAQAMMVGTTAVLVTGTTISTALRTRKRPDTRSALMAVAFLAMAITAIARTLAFSPAIGISSPGLARMTDVAVLPIGAIVLLLSVAPELRQRRQLDLVVQSGPALALFLLAVLALSFSAGDRIPVVPVPGSNASLALFAVGALLFCALARRAARTAVLTGRATDVIVTVGTITAAGAMWALTNATGDDALWWTAHVLEFVGLAAMCIPASRDLGRSSASRPLVGDLRAADIVADEESFLDGRVHHLMLQLGRKDDVTEGHTRRVATLAVRMGEQLGLDGTSLRDLAAGGLLHDIGKLETPDGILKKPGALTDTEYEIIKRHPAAGRAILDEIGSFNERVLHLVEAHHERLDGRGYPSGIRDEAIYIEARILAVADVFDALTSQRPYRVAWPADRALEVIERDAGTAFDERCVEALRTITSGSRLIPAPSFSRAPPPVLAR